MASSNTACMEVTFAIVTIPAWDNLLHDRKCNPRVIFAIYFLGVDEGLLRKMDSHCKAMLVKYVLGASVLHRLPSQDRHNLVECSQKNINNKVW